MLISTIGRNLTYAGGIIWIILGVFLCFAGTWIVQQPHLYSEKTTGSATCTTPPNSLHEHRNTYVCENPVITYVIDGKTYTKDDYGTIESNTIDVTNPETRFPVYYNPHNKMNIHVFDSNNPVREGVFYIALGLIMISISISSIVCVKTYDSCSSISGFIWIGLGAIGVIAIVSQVHMISWIRKLNVLS